MNRVLQGLLIVIVLATPAWADITTREQADAALPTGSRSCRVA